MNTKKNTYIINERSIDVQMVFSARKTIELKILSSTSLQMKVPYGTSEETVRYLLAKKEKWLVMHMDKMAQVEMRKERFSYEEGSRHFFLGQALILEKVIRPLTSIEVKGNRLIIGVVQEDKVPLIIENWYKEKAKVILPDRVGYYQPLFQVKPSLIQVKEQKKRWGSCNSKRELRFNWRLIKAPIEVIDYVIIHEMCHMLHMNHSKEFWQAVSIRMKDYKVKKAWLKEYGTTLFEGEHP